MYENLYVLLSGIILLTMSCKTILYVPNAVNAPLLKEKNEIKAYGSPNNAQIAYAVSNHIGIMGNAYGNKFTSENTTNGVTTKDANKGNLFELGLGYFNPLSENLVFETYIGGGLGKIDFDNQTQNKHYDVKATKFFVQPAIGYVHKFFDIAFTPRISAVEYNDLNVNGYTQDELNNEYLNKDDVEGKTWFFAEPAITARLGYKFVKIQAQFGFVSKLASGDLKYDSKFTNIGISLNLAKWYR